MANQRKWTLLVLALAAASTFCGAPAAQDSAGSSAAPAGGSSEVAAKVGDREITFAEVDELLKKRNQKAYQAYYDARKKILDQLINEEVVGAEAEAKGASALALSMPFDELSVLGDNLPYLCAMLNVAKIHLYTDAAGEGPQPEVQQQAVPGKPTSHFYFSDDLSGPPPPASVT